MTPLAEAKSKTGHPNGLPGKSRGIWSDSWRFLLHRPEIPTRIDSSSETGREKYTRRIKQRLGVSVEDYAILNIHRIGIDAPAAYVFEELLEWREVARCWPAHIAKLERVEGNLEHIHVLLFGRTKPLLGLKSKLFGLNVVPLFKMEALKLQQVPSAADIDNARYLLYKCRGGYPIGIFSLYVRSSIAQEGETEQTQIFLVVGFNFYGKKDWPETHIINRVWELIHNRVTANVLNRLKQLCEARIREFPAGV
ncbi:MAG: hypothetical protein ACYS15_06675 [Planctomycetota bacterium]|jgi:hypothetical protein